MGQYLTLGHIYSKRNRAVSHWTEPDKAALHVLHFARFGGFKDLSLTRWKSGKTNRTCFWFTVPFI